LDRRLGGPQSHSGRGGEEERNESEKQEGIDKKNIEINEPKASKAEQ
jgi:hypothetical protein